MNTDFFPKPQTTFLTCFSRGKRQNTPEKKFHLNWVSNSQPPGHESDTLTTEPLRRGLVVGDENAGSQHVLLFSTMLTNFISTLCKISSTQNLNPLLTHYQMTNFRLLRTERVCRRQYKFDIKRQKVIQTGRKHCRKRRNCLLQGKTSNFSFSHSVFEKLVSQGRQKVSLCGNGLIKRQKLKLV